MRIEVITAWYNEEFLAPFFLRYYGSIADRITVLLDSATDDWTLDVLKKTDYNINIINIDYGAQMRERKKADYLTLAYRNSNADYVINADADEFVFVDRDDFNYDYDVARVKLFNVYRHEKEKDLDINLDIKEQRRYGEHVWPFLKPIVIKTGLNIKWTSGNHSIICNGNRELYKKFRNDSGLVYRKNLIGAHWIYADPCFCIRRRMDRLNRFGSSLHDDFGEEKIKAKLVEHSNDNQVW